MIKIKTQADLKQLKSCAEVSPDYYQIVAHYTLQLIESLCPLEIDPTQYNLENDGIVVVLTSEDNPHKLAEVGLPDGIANSFPGPEWIEFHELSDGTGVYQIVYLFDNSYAVTYYLEKNLWLDDPIIQQFLQEQIAYDEIYNGEGRDL